MIEREKLRIDFWQGLIDFPNSPPQKDEAAEKMITQILEKYPQHKRVLLFKTLYLQQQTLPTLEKAELEKFYKILLK